MSALLTEMAAEAAVGPVLNRRVVSDADDSDDDDLRPPSPPEPWDDGRAAFVCTELDDDSSSLVPDGFIPRPDSDIYVASYMKVSPSSRSRSRSLSLSLSLSLSRAQVPLGPRTRLYPRIHAAPLRLATLTPAPYSFVCFESSRARRGCCTWPTSWRARAGWTTRT